MDVGGRERRLLLAYRDDTCLLGSFEHEQKKVESMGLKMG